MTGMKNNDISSMSSEEMTAYLKQSMPEMYYKASEHTMNHKTETLESEMCGCYYCCSVFKPSEIDEWITDASDNEFAMCPSCGIDAVIGDKSGYPVTDIKFLKDMNKYWFEEGIVEI